MRILNAPWQGWWPALPSIGGQRAAQQPTITPLMTKISKWAAIPDSEGKRCYRRPSHERPDYITDDGAPRITRGLITRRR